MAEYKIIVDFKGGQTQNQEDANNFTQMTSASAVGEQTFAQSSNAFSALTNGMGSMFATLMIVREAEKIGRQVFSNEIQLVGRYTGSQQAQDVANATLDIISKIKSPIESIISYAYDTQRRLYERTWESIGMQLTRERGGASLNRSRTDG